jgi:hypothetical protein
LTNLLASTDIAVTMLEDPQFPPLLKGHAVAPGVAASACALDALRDGKAGAGDLFWSRSEDRLNMAVVLEPDVALGKAAQMQHVMMVAFGDAFGAILPRRYRCMSAGRGTFWSMAQRLARLHLRQQCRGCR